jgi:tetratricopeptide (TPR) repeat protein
MDDRLKAIIEDSDQHGPAAERRAYAEQLDAAYPQIREAEEAILAEPSWDDLPPEQVVVRLRLLSQLVRHYARTGHHAELHRTWGRRSLELGAAAPAASRAELLLQLSEIERSRGDLDAAGRLVSEAAQVLDGDAGDDRVTGELRLRQGLQAAATGDTESARGSFEQARDVLAEPSAMRAYTLMNLALLATAEHRLEDALDLESEAAETAFLAGDHEAHLAARNNKACTLRLMQRTEQAYAAFLDLLPEVLWEETPQASLIVAEDFATVLVDLRRHDDAAMILGAVDAGRAATGLPREPQQAEVMGEVEAALREALGDRWQAQFDAGRAGTVGDAVRRVTG